MEDNLVKSQQDSCQAIQLAELEKEPRTASEEDFAAAGEEASA